MALVTLQRSPPPSAASSSASSAITSAEEDLASDDYQGTNNSLVESFVMVKGAALFLQQGSSDQEPKTLTQHKNAGDLPQHLQAMINTLRSEDKVRLAVQVESGCSDHPRYMVFVYTNGNQDTEENILLGMDFTNNNSKSCSIGLILPLWSDTRISLDGDGGFSISTAGRSHVFKPVSMQAMWSALQVLHKACEVSRRCNYSPGGMALTWMGFYEISSEQSCINEWNATSDPETSRPDSPTLFSDQPTERERTECLIRTKLRNIMMLQDLENITSKEIRNELEQQTSWNLQDYKTFIDNEMLHMLGQMDKATQIFDHLYLGSEWNASNLEELRDCGIGYILNVTPEIDNFFSGTFCYHNVCIYDDETTDVLADWNETYNFIVRAKKNNSKCLVHCKMGVSHSASTVIAYAMKEYSWSLEKAYHYVKQKRSIAQPSTTFMRQLAEYESTLDASKQQHSADDSLEGLQAAGTSDSLTLPEQELCMWGCRDARGSPCCRDEPIDHVNYNYYFRRLSDTALDSEPSTPVRGPPLLGMEHVLIEIEDVERDALLDDDGIPMAHLALPSEGTAAQTCSRLEPLEDMRLRLEFSTVEEEDEEEAQKEEAEMAALARGQETTPSGREQVNLANPNSFNNENANNSNRLAGKRSCPSGFDDSASSGNPHKVKPSYQLCRDCLRLPGGRRSERRTNRLNLLRHAGLSSISIKDPGAGHLSCMPIRCQLPPPASRHQLCSPCCKSPIPAALATSMDAYRQRLASPMSCEELPCDSQCTLGPEEMDELQEMEDENESKVAFAGHGTELTLVELSLQSKRPTAELHQEANLHKEARSGRQRPEQLELMDLGMEDVSTEDMEVDLGSVPGMSSSLPNHPISHFASVSSLQHWALTRSSSSDSVQLVQLGLVHQRAQGIETRMRMAGLTTSSRLQRSNSLAKLGGLAVSTHDLLFSSQTEPVISKTSPSSPTYALTVPLLHSFPG
ncbi:protein phosphatase Slingshot homolog 1 [Salminus brasiliensis]|uniref:protein phosphatase Slingshot homolog 1 n=1 Tax=Salminus brasiliensis TaxID=930266 RepID=UPI003B82EA56